MTNGPLFCLYRSHYLCLFFKGKQLSLFLYSLLSNCLTLLYTVPLLSRFLELVSVYVHQGHTHHHHHLLHKHHSKQLAINMQLPLTFSRNERFGYSPYQTNNQCTYMDASYSLLFPIYCLTCSFKAFFNFHVSHFK